MVPIGNVVEHIVPNQKNDSQRIFDTTSYLPAVIGVFLRSASPPSHWETVDIDRGRWCKTYYGTTGEASSAFGTLSKSRIETSHRRKSGHGHASTEKVEVHAEVTAVNNGISRSSNESPAIAHTYATAKSAKKSLRAK